MMQLGDHTIPTGPDEEIVVRPTWWEALLRKVFPDPWAAEMREAWLQEARRIKAINDARDIFEQKKAEQETKEKERENDFKIVCVIIKTLTRGDKNITSKLGLFRSKHRAQVKLLSVTNDKGQIQDNGSVFSYSQSTVWYITLVQPWLDGTFTTEQLKEKTKDDKNWKWVI